ncbi:MAG: 5'-nucleotidase domain-containing protein, partial [Myxococcota bacterium]
RTVVDLAEPRWVFLNTLFSLSAGSMYRALVDLLDADQLPSGQHMNYADLYRTMQRSLDEAHMEGQLKADIIADPDQFVDLDPDTPTALLDQKQAGKKMLLITNSGWVYTLHMMTYAFDRFLPEGMTWRDLFDVIIVSARKPAFFSENLPAFEVVDDSGLLRPCNGSLEKGKAYCGGHAGLIEATLGLSSAEILYVGDHVYGDVHASKSVRRWRTALIAREMEEEVNALQAFQPQQQQLSQLMRDKVRLERRAVRIKLHQQRLGHSSPPDPDLKAQVKEALDQIQTEIAALDDRIRPLAVAASRLGNPTWGLIMRTGNDKSLMARQVERHADVYTSRVSNFLYETPFSYIRSSRGSLPHDPEGAINPFPSDGV